MKFTIIIPAYNSAEFINIPLDSLEKQTFKENFEVLIINDGSKDKIKNVLKPYLLRNKTWKMITKKNGNWGSVMNFVKYNVEVLSDYITILDSDDYFDETMLEKVSQHNDDIVITGINKKFTNKEKKMPVYFSKGLIKKERAFTPVSTPHGKFYKRELWYKMEDLVHDVSYQDTVMFNDLVSKADSIYYIKEPLATWWWDRPGNSTSVEWNKDRADLWIDTCQRVVDLEDGHDERLSWAIMYLWELKRQYGKETTHKVEMDVSKAKFKWIMFGFRTLAKKYFIMKTKKYIEKKK